MRLKALSPAVTIMLIAAVFLPALPGCASVAMRNGISDADLARSADVAGMPGVRFWGDEQPRDFRAEVRRRLPNMPALAQGVRRSRDGRPIIDILALSGGGGDGAFGAGLLNGWTMSGRRPKFELVTGVSAGAIIAPFAFLGPKYDPALEDIWTRYRTAQIATAQILPGLLGGSAIADNTPLKALIATYVTPRLIREVAREYQKGRVLLVGTTNLDAQRQMVWNMGEIARIGGKKGLELFRDVILASASIPGAFPPVSISVRAADGKIYQEMHVDGGTTREIFISPVDVPLSQFDNFYGGRADRRIYLVQNSKAAPEQTIVEPTTLAITSRALSTLIKTQSRDETYRIYRRAKDDGADFNFIAIPADFDGKANEFFDPVYQRQLFDRGVEVARHGVPWDKQPPVIRAPRTAP